MPRVAIEGQADEEAETRSPLLPPSKPWKCPTCPRQWRPITFLISWILTGLLFLSLGVYYQVSVCAKYPDWANQWCNTTKFDTIMTPFSGVVGLVNVEYSNGKCDATQCQVFTCSDLQDLGHCIAVGTVQFQVGSMWPCFLEDPTCHNICPALQPPDKLWLPGCVNRTAFFITGGIITGLWLIFAGPLSIDWRLCQ